MEVNFAQPLNIKPLRAGMATHEQQLEGARELQDAFHDFVGKTFFGEMLKSMRTTVGKPAYFHGGQGEEVFSAQLDQQIVDKISDSNDGSISKAMFRLQFPEQAKLIEAAEQRPAASLTDLSSLRRR